MASVTSKIHCTSQLYCSGFPDSGGQCRVLGLFPSYSLELRLTADGGRAADGLAAMVLPFERQLPLSQHREPSRWSCRRDCVILESVRRGQEFVLDCDHCRKPLAA